MVFFVFDLLFLNGEDIRDLPLVDGKTRLEAFLVGVPESLRHNDHIRSAKARPSIAWPASTASKASSPSALMVGMSPVGAHG
jgi:ATP-dependent DNA ligase